MLKAPPFAFASIFFVFALCLSGRVDLQSGIDRSDDVHGSSVSLNFGQAFAQSPGPRQVLNKRETTRGSNVTRQTQTRGVRQGAKRPATRRIHRGPVRLSAISQRRVEKRRARLQRRAAAARAVESQSEGDTVSSTSEKASDAAKRERVRSRLEAVRAGREARMKEMSAGITRQLGSGGQVRRSSEQTSLDSETRRGSRHAFRPAANKTGVQGSQVAVKRALFPSSPPGAQSNKQSNSQKLAASSQAGPLIRTNQRSAWVSPLATTSRESVRPRSVVTLNQNGGPYVRASSSRDGWRHSGVVAPRSTPVFKHQKTGTTRSGARHQWRPPS